MMLKIEIRCACQHVNLVNLHTDINEYYCPSCKNRLFNLYVMTGYIYILSNPSMPNLLKIGYTERSVFERVEELNSTGVPVPFQIEAFWESGNPRRDEQIIHSNLINFRVSVNREFFQIDIKTAINNICEFINCQPSFLKEPTLLMTESEKQKLLEEQIENRKVSTWVSIQLSKLDKDFKSLEHLIKYKGMHDKVVCYFNNIYRGIHEEWMNQLQIDHNLPCPPAPSDDWFEKLKKEQELLEAQWKSR